MRGIGLGIEDLTRQRTEPGKKTPGLVRKVLSEATSNGSSRDHKPVPVERKSGIPEGVEIPAPVRITAYVSTGDQDPRQIRCWSQSGMKGRSSRFFALDDGIGNLEELLGCRIGRLRHDSRCLQALRACMKSSGAGVSVAVIECPSFSCTCAQGICASVRWRLFKTT
jgi:hypothetical protein